MAYRSLPRRTYGAVVMPLLCFQPLLWLQSFWFNYMHFSRTKYEIFNRPNWRQQEWHTQRDLELYMMRKDGMVLNKIETCSWVLIEMYCMRKSTFSSTPEIKKYDEAQNCSNSSSSANGSLWKTMAYKSYRANHVAAVVQGARASSRFLHPWIICSLFKFCCLIYRKVSNIRCTKSQNLNASRFIL